MSVEEDIRALRADSQGQGAQVNLLHRKLDVTVEIVQRIDEHVKTQNGQVAGVMAAQLRQEGATGMLKWVIGVVVIPTLAICVAVGGIALGIVIRGG